MTRALCETGRRARQPDSRLAAGRPVAAWLSLPARGLRRRRAPWLAALGLILLAARSAAPSSRLGEIRTRIVERRVLVSWLLEGAFSAEAKDRIDSGLELSFDYTVELKRMRGRLPDKTVAEREVTASVRFSNLTKMYTLTRRVDGTVTEQDVTERRNAMIEWMTAFEDIELFGPRDLDRAGTYYLKLRAKLLDRFFLMFWPSDVKTDWIQSEPVRVLPPGAAP